MTKKMLAGLILEAAVQLPITLYLWCKVMSAVQASELMWFLFFAYIPTHRSR